MTVAPRPGRVLRAPTRVAVVLFALSLGIALGMPGAAPARAESPELAAARALIAANGWSWQADDTWLNSLTPAQRANLRGYAPPPGYEDTLKAHLQVLPVAKDLPSSFDWRWQGGVTSVKNQGQCGACWDFAATAVIESFVKIYYGQELDLSEEQILACNTNGASCAGGWADPVYRIARDYGQIHEDCLPYVEGASTSCPQAQHHPLARVTGWRYIANDLTQLKTALLTGPVASAIDGSGAFETYNSGCYEGGTSYTNHMVEIVGWDDRMCNNQGAWICKNSWGAGWGMSGMFYIKYGVAGIGSGATQPLYTAPPVRISVTAPLPTDTLIAGTQVPIRWLVTQGVASTVDIWFSAGDICFETRLATGVPNTGSWTWTVPNIGTAQARIMIYPSAGIANGYGFTQPLRIIGHQTRYVSTIGSGTAPYLTPATAARTIAACVAACTGLDTVMVAAGDYQESVLVNAPIKLLGGWNSVFTQRDPAHFLTRMQGLASAFRLRAGVENVGEINGFTFHDGAGSDYDEPAFGRYGGGILSIDGSPTIRNCRFENNLAHPLGGFGLGGGAMVLRGAPRFENCVFTGNSASSGGAITLVDAAGAVLGNCTFLANSGGDSTASGHVGGAIYAKRGIVTIDGGLLRGNFGVWEGGGVFADSAAVTVSGTEVALNRATQGGGGVLARGGSLTLHGLVVRDNRAGAGGGAGVAVEGAPASLCNSRMTGNITGGLGGGARLAGVTGGRVENCVLSGNTAGVFGGGLFLNPTGAFVMRNTVVSGNTGNGVFAGGGTASIDYNNVWNNVGGDYGGQYGRGAHDLAGDPVFTDAAAGDYAPGVHSCCVDRGDPDPTAGDPDGSRADIGVHGGPAAVVVAPAPVTGAALAPLGGGRWRVSWNPSGAPDIARYLVYRDTARSFLPTPTKLLASVNPPAVEWTDDGPVPAGSYYLVVPVDAAGHAGGYSSLLPTALTTVGDGAVPAVVRIAVVAPNPFNPRTTVWFDLPRAGEATLAVYDLRGRLVRTLTRGALPAGQHRVDWDGRDEGGRTSATGAYVLRLAAGGVVRSLKVSLAK